MLFAGRLVLGADDKDVRLERVEILDVGRKDDTVGSAVELAKDVLNRRLQRLE